MDQEELKKIAIQYGHWLALIVAIGAVVAVIVVGADTKTQKVQIKIAKDIEELKRARTTNSPQVEEMPNYMAMIKANWAPIKSAQPGPTGTYLYEQSSIKYRIATPPMHQWINKPTNVAIQVDREKITFSWDAPPPLIGSDGKQKEPSPIDGYHLMKAWANRSGKQQKIHTLGSGETTFEDNKVESKVDYYYKVRAFTNNTEAKGGKKVSYEGKKMVVSEYTQAKKGTILPIYKLRLTGVSGKTAFVELSKWVKGDWRSISFHIQKGSKIAKQAYIKELKDRVVFDPGWRLVDLTTRAVVWRYTMIKKMVLKEDGKTPVIDPITRRPKMELVKTPIRSYVPAIKYVDENNKEHLKYQEAKKNK